MGWIDLENPYGKESNTARNRWQCSSDKIGVVDSQKDFT